MAGPTARAGIHHRRVQTRRHFAAGVAPDHLEDKGLAGGILESVVETEHDREDAHLPKAHHVW